MKLDYYAQRALPLSYVVVVGSLYFFAPYGETGHVEICSCLHLLPSSLGSQGVTGDGGRIAAKL